MRVLLASLLLTGYLLAGLAGPVAAQTSDLVSENAFRVCADPANLPQSHENGQGYENRIADLIAGELDRPVHYFWFPMSVGFVRNSLAANQCDIIMGYSAGHELVLNTNPYYTSVYVLVTKPDSAYSDIDHLGDERLRDARIGVVAGTQPASHLAYYRLMANVEPYHLFVDRRHHNANQQMLDDLASGKTDVALMWGPIGGPMVKQQYPGFVVTPLLKEERQPFLFARITMGVRLGEIEWKRSLNSQIRRQQKAIDAILREAGVPLLAINGKSLKPEN